MNKVILHGNLGSDVELRYTQAGKPVANFRMATNERFGDNERTEWHRIVVWNKVAENCGKFLEKGREILIEGRIQTRQWEDNEGNKRYTTEIVAYNVKFLSGGRKTKNQVNENVTNDSTLSVNQNEAEAADLLQSLDVPQV